MGHVAKICHGKREPGEREEKKIHYLYQEDNSEVGLFTIETINCIHTDTDTICVNPQINGTTLCMELDTGASVSLVSERVWREKLNAVPLKPSSLRLRTYTGEPLELLGQAQVHVVYEGQSATLPMLVVSGDGPSLFGRNWFGAIYVNWGEKENPLYA